MYLRFEVDQINQYSGKPSGIFSLAYELLENADLEIYQRKRIRMILDYFKAELPVPSKFTKKKNDAHVENTPGLSWLKSEATEMVNRFWELKNLLEECGYTVNIIKTSYAGKIVYEDQYQIVAV